jgi:hypothetical protein
MVSSSDSVNHPALPKEKAAEALVRMATERTIQILEGYGNKLTPAHAEAIHDIQGNMAAIFLGAANGRRVFDLPTAMGKTTAIRGFAYAVNSLNLKGRIIICCEKVKAICDLRKALIDEEKIPEGNTRLIHSYKFDAEYYDRDVPAPQTAPFESDKEINEERHQFVLITHSKLHGGFKNLTHSLMIYDEGLVLGRSLPLDVGGLRSRLLALKGCFEADKGIKDENILTVYGWLDDAEKQLRSIMDEDFSGEKIFAKLGVLSFDEIVEPYIKRLVKNDFDSGSVDLEGVIEFIRKAGTGERVRFLRCQGSYTIIFNPTIPDTLQKLVVFDASFSIRKINESIKGLDCPRSYIGIKDCSDITVYFAKARSGLIKETAKLATRLVDLGKSVLLFIHKESNFSGSYIHDAKLKDKWARMSKSQRRRYQRINPVESLTSALLKEMKTDALPETVRIATWGHETAENKWGNVDAVIFVTVNELPHAAVYTRRIDQTQDQAIELTGTELQAMIKSEKAHQLLQAIGRGGRTITNGKAAKLDVYVFSADWEELKPYLLKGLYGMRIAPYEPITDEFQERIGTKDRSVQALLKVLNNHPEKTISTKSLWKIVDADNKIPSRTRNRAISALIADTTNPWHKQSDARRLTSIAA